MALPVLLLAVAAGLVAAAPAGAADVEIQLGSGREGWRVVYEAAPGERNDVRFRNTGHYTIRVHDPAVPLDPGARCRAIDRHTVQCSVPADPGTDGFSPYLSSALVRLRDGNDRAVVENVGLGLPQLVADGGPGNDVLTGAGGGDQLDGGGGRDHLTGGENNNTLTDGDGRDGAPVDADVLEEGILDYSARTGDLVIDLIDDRPDGERGEGDRLAGIDGVIAGAGDDRLVGGPEFSQLWGGPGDDDIDGGLDGDSLYGGPGQDLLRGREGDDVLFGDVGRDRMLGDDGDDHLSDVAGDAVACGAGLDLVTEGRGVFLPPDCEQNRLSFGPHGYPTPEDDFYLTLEPIPVLTSTGRSLRVVVGCPQNPHGDGTCYPGSGVVRVASPSGRLLGAGRVSWEDLGGRSQMTALVPLNALGRKLASRRAILRISINGANLPTATWRARAVPAGGDPRS